MCMIGLWVSRARATSARVRELRDGELHTCTPSGEGIGEPAARRGDTGDTGDTGRGLRPDGRAAPRMSLECRVNCQCSSLPRVPDATCSKPTFLTLSTASKQSARCRDTSRPRQLRLSMC